MHSKCISESCTNLVSPLLSTQSQIRNVHSLPQTSLGRGVKQRIERNVFEDFVYA